MRLAHLGQLAALGTCVGVAVAACNSLTGVDGVSVTTTSTTGHTSTTSPDGGSGGGGLAPAGGSSSGGAAASGGSGAGAVGGGGSTATTTTDTTTTTTSTTATLHECPPPGGQDCSPGEGTPGPDDCGDDPSCFLSVVQQAVTGLLNSQPAQFYPVPEHSDCLAPYDVNWFMEEVVTYIESQGLCVTRDPPGSEEEVSVKLNNAYAENFDIVASWGCARYGGGIYTGWCTNVWW
jgi:hypothetical protein